MARESGTAPAVLRTQITSTAGATAAALAVLDDAGIRPAFLRAVHAARLRSAEMATLYPDS
jgi:pyrroline-5-carboxylate reductase